VAAEVIVIPRSCSCSIQSIVAVPSCTSPICSSRPCMIEHPLGSRLLPASMCAAIPMLRCDEGCLSRQRASSLPAIVAKALWPGHLVLSSFFLTAPRAGRLRP